MSSGQHCEDLANAGFEEEHESSVRLSDAEAKAQVCMDLHAALGVRWGEDPYAAITCLRESNTALLKAAGKFIVWASSGIDGMPDAEQLAEAVEAARAAIAKAA